ncbi:hypothetical protein [Amycolatopsis plumensis]|uniref:Uncharacterized protein n=1 Tax=Amycolatopsis plumensis TaxID=236508 RepID=A0ABV5TUX5_9PSEU
MAVLAAVRGVVGVKQSPLGAATALPAPAAGTTRATRESADTAPSLMALANRSELLMEELLWQRPGYPGW